MNFIAALLIVTAAALVCCQASSGDSKSKSTTASKSTETYLSTYAVYLHSCCTVADVYQDPPYKKSVDQVDSHRYAAMLGKR